MSDGMSDSNDTYRLVDDALDDRADDEVLSAITRALERHGDAVNDGARLIIDPLPRAALIEQLSLYPHVSAYVMVTLDQVLNRSEATFKLELGRRLSVDLPISTVEYEIVWAGKRSLLMYVKGDVGTGPA
jgi:hypothetical protein